MSAVGFFTDHPERQEQLKQLWAKGLTGSQIATTMGAPGRGSVLKQARKMGLSVRGNGPRKNQQKPTHIVRSRRAGRIMANTGNSNPVQSLYPARPPVPLPPREGQPQLSDYSGKLMDIADEGCRYPIGELFCGKPGAKPSRGLSYCPDCSKFANLRRSA